MQSHFCVRSIYVLYVYGTHTSTIKFRKLPPVDRQHVNGTNYRKGYSTSSPLRWVILSRVIIIFTLPPGNEITMVMT